MKFASPLSVWAIAGASLALYHGGGVSAQEDYDPTDTIFDIVESSPVHGSLAIMMEGALPAITEALSNANASMTIFAPNDNAFSELGGEAFTLLLTEPWIQHLTCVLSAHIYGGGAIPSADVAIGEIIVESLLPGFELNLSGTTDPMTVNGVPVTTADINATNGIIHSISEVLMPPCFSQDLLTVLSENPLFATLVALLGTVDLTDVLSALPTEEGLTILAPTADAFANVAPEVMAYLGMNPEALLQVVQYHIIPNNYDGSVEGEMNTLLDGETIDVMLHDDMLMLNGVAHVTKANILASNGVIHEIDSVLLPASLNISASSPVSGGGGGDIDPTLANTTAPPETNTTMPPVGTTNMTAPPVDTTNMTTSPVDTNSTMPPVDTNSTMPPAGETNMTEPVSGGGDDVTQSLLDIVSNSEAHATLAAAVGAITRTADDGSDSNSIADLLSDETKSLTVFAPDEDAFAKSLAAGTLDLLLTDPWKAHLECVLMAHVYDEGTVLSSDITEAMTVDSLSKGYELDLEPGDPITVNGIPIATPDIPATNGVIHSLSEGVLLPPCVKDDIVTILSGRDDFTQLVTMATASNMVSSLSSLPAAEGLTILAPSNSALGKLDPIALAGLASENMNALTDILKYHIIESNFDGSTTGSVTTKLGEVVQVTRDDDGVLMVNGAKVLEENILASNGVIHVIDTILIPPSLANTPGLPKPETSGTGGSGAQSGGGGSGSVGQSGESSGASSFTTLLSNGLVATAVAGVAALVL